MNTKTKKLVEYIVFIGRMQPPHAAHIEIIWQALLQGETVIILIGSANQPRTPDNPWTWKEREEMIRACFDAQYQDRLKFRPLSDVVGDTAWAVQVQNQVDNVINKDIRQKEFLDVNFTPEIKIIGHKKDRTSFYLEMFPQWKEIMIDNIDGLHATDIRLMMFNGGEIERCIGVPSGIRDFINAFMLTEAYARLVEEYLFILKYKSQFAGLQYPPIFVTVDSIVTCAGHVLLVKRRSNPGAGTWATPGGFVNPDEYLEAAAIRELREETLLKVPVPVLRGSIQNTKVFDAPGRSMRGRTITHAFYFELSTTDGKLPRVKGADDALHAKWIPLSTVDKMEDQMFEDHYRMVTYFTGT